MKSILSSIYVKESNKENLKHYAHLRPKKILPKTNNRKYNHSLIENLN